MRATDWPAGADLLRMRPDLRVSVYFALAWLGLSLAAPGLSAGAPGADRARELLARAEGQDDLAALQTLALAREAAPQNPVVHYRIGYLYHKMNRLPEARSAYETALQFDRCAAGALNNLGNILKKQGELERAIDLFERACECDPRAFLPHYNLGNVYREAGRYEQAADAYERALKIEPDHGRSRHNLGLVYMIRAERTAGAGDVRFQENYARARRELDAAIRLLPRDPRARLTRASLHELGGAADQALADYRAALRFLPQASSLRADAQRRVQTLETQLRAARAASGR